MMKFADYLLGNWVSKENQDSISIDFFLNENSELKITFKKKTESLSIINKDLSLINNEILLSNSYIFVLTLISEDSFQLCEVCNGFCFPTSGILKQYNFDRVKS